MYRVKITAKRSEHVATLAEASAACRRYIDAKDLGASRWSGGAVLDAAGNVVARVSYNGRIWTPEPWPECREITSNAGV